MLADQSDKITGVCGIRLLSYRSSHSFLSPWQPLFWECIRYLILTRFPICIRLLRPKLHRRSWKRLATRLFHNTDIENLYKNPSATYTNLLVDLYADSTSTFFAVLKIFNTFWDEHFDFIIFILGISAILAFLYHIFVNNILIIGEKRFFLESKNYKDTRISKIFFLL